MLQEMLISIKVEVRHELVQVEYALHFRTEKSQTERK